MSPDRRKRPGRARKGKPGGTDRPPAAGPPYEVLWHPQAVAEHRAIQDSGERVEIQHAIEKLVSARPRLPFPHQSAVKGKHGKGLRELRPRAGRSPWRPLYRQLGNRLVILAVGPEAQVDSHGFDDAVERAQTRFAELEH